MRLSVSSDAGGAAQVAAAEIARACGDAIAARGRAVIAVSGGETPWLMLRELRALPLDWARIHVVQVDERVAPRGDTRRNLTRLEEILVGEGPLREDHLHAMPVESADLDDASRTYQAKLEELTRSTPGVLDVVQLGLGTDGHTASLVPGDHVLAVVDRDVAVTGPYQGLPRMTLTYPALSRARERLWLVTGAAKAKPFAQLLRGDGGDAPALRVARERSLAVVDVAAAGL